MFLLGIVSCHLSHSADKVHRGLASEGLLWLASVCFLVLVKHNLASLQDHTELLPRSVGRLLGSALPLMFPDQHSLQFPIRMFNRSHVVIILKSVFASSVRSGLLLKSKTPKRRLGPCH